MIKTVIVCNRCKSEKELDFDQVAMNRTEAVGEAGYYEMKPESIHMCEECFQLRAALLKEQAEQLEKFTRGMEIDTKTPSKKSSKNG